jgi:ribosomal protein L37AE/L43A
MTQYWYCKKCKKEVENPIRKPMKTFHKVIWIIVIIASVGIAALVFAIYYYNRKKVYCPVCFSKLEVSSKPFEKEGEEEETVPKTPKEKILKKTGKEIPAKKQLKEEEVEEIEEKERIKPEQTFCPYCGEDIKLGTKRCPYCGSSLKGVK